MVSCTTWKASVEALVLWFAVWLGWQYTCWLTNWFVPETHPIRRMLFAIMLVALVMAASIPQAFGPRGLVFALSFVVIQCGRTLFVLGQLGSRHPLTPNFQRMLGWLLHLRLLLDRRWAGRGKRAARLLVCRRDLRVRRADDWLCFAEARAVPNERLDD